MVNVNTTEAGSCSCPLTYSAKQFPVSIPQSVLSDSAKTDSLRCFPVLFL